MEKLIGIIGAVLLLGVRILLDWIMFDAEKKLNSNNFFYRTGRLITPLLTLGLLRVEEPDNVGLLDWRTLPERVGDWIGFLFWAAVLVFALKILLGIAAE